MTHCSLANLQLVEEHSEIACSVQNFYFKYVACGHFEAIFRPDMVRTKGDGGAARTVASKVNCVRLPWMYL